MEQMYKQVVEHIFSNWTALQLAVEHGMGGGNSKQIATACVDYLVDYLTKEPDIELEDIEDVLEDIMDKEFDTVCEDNSIKEVSTVMFRFLQLLKENNIAQFEVEYKRLPASKDWLPKGTELPHSQTAMNGISESDSSEPSTDTQMEAEDIDPGWTQVKTRRKH